MKIAGKGIKVFLVVSSFCTHYAMLLANSILNNMPSVNSVQIIVDTVKNMIKERISLGGKILNAMKGVN